MPPNSKTAYMPIILWLALFSMDVQAAIDNAGIMDNVLDRYSAAASSWAGVVTSAATWLFWTLVIISMVWTFGMMALRKADIGEFFAEFVRFTVFTGFFWWLLTNGPNFASSIYTSLRQVAGNATGLGNTLSPSGIVDVGFAIFDKVMDQSTLWSPVDSMTGILMAVAILVILALVGVNMLLLLTSGWVLAYGGVFFLGFGGSRWTTDMAINYYKTVLGIAAQLMAMVLLVGIGKTFLDDYYTRMSEGISLKEMGVMMIVTIVLLALVNKIPPLIAGIITGASVGGAGIGNYGAGAALGATSMAWSATQMAGSGIMAGGASAAGGAQALMAAVSKANDNVANGTDILSNFGRPSDGGSSSGDGSTNYAQAAGFTNAGSSGSSMLTSAAKVAGIVGRIAADATANLAQGATEVAKEKATSIKEAGMDRIADTTGGKIAAAIKGQGSIAPTFDGNTLASATSSDADQESEVAAFRDRDNNRVNL